MRLFRLLDISGMFHPIWRVKEGAGKPIGEAAAETVQALREHAARAGADFVIACCDAPGRTFRHGIAEEYRVLVPDYKGYKGHRPEKDAAMMAALERVIDELEQDGIPIMRAPGFEADDVIATIAAWATAAGDSVEVVSEDKDLLALARDVDPDNDTAPSVVVIRRDGKRQGYDACVERLGVPPELVPAMLAMAGDTSDGILGIPGIGKKTAAGLLWGEWVGKEWQPTPFRRFGAMVDAAVEEQALVEMIEREKLRRRVEAGTKKNASDATIAERLKIAVEDVERYRALPPVEIQADYKPRFAADVRRSLIANAENYDIGLRLAELRRDVPLDFAALTAPRVPKPKADAGGFQIDGYEDDNEPKEKNEMPPSEDFAMPPQPAAAPSSRAPSSAPAVAAEIVNPLTQAPVGATVAAPLAVHVAPPAREMAVREIQQVTEQSLAPRGGAYSLSLDPRDFREARMLAKDIFDARIFPKIQSAQQALAFIMTGREYGMPAMASCRLIHNIEGMMAVHAQVKIGLAMKSPRIEYMHIREWVDDGENSYCVWVGKRRSRPKEDTCRYGVADAKRQQLVKPASNWVKIPGWMSMVRSGANMATILIPDEMAGLYTFDEAGAAEVVLHGSDPNDIVRQVGA